MPVYGQVDPHFFASWSKLLANWNLDVAIYPHFGDSLVSRARNHCTRVFLESDCTHMLFIDSDLVFSVDQINRMMEFDEDLVGGAYYKKCEGAPQGVWNCLPDVNLTDSGLLEVKYVGTGFMRISRKVFELMIQEFGNEISYQVDPDHKQKEYDFWHVGRYVFSDGSPNRYLSEDWWFCQKWRDIGGKVWLDRGTVLKHSGNALYPLSYQDKIIFNRVPAAKPATTVDQPSGATVLPTLVSEGEILQTS